MKKTNEISLFNPLRDVDSAIYSKFSKKVKQVQVSSGAVKKKLDDESQQILVNYSYLIYEFLEFNHTREIDYRKVKKFATAYKGILKYIFDDSPVVPKLNSWLKEDTELVEMAMYTQTDRFNKNIYH